MPAVVELDRPRTAVGREVLELAAGGPVAGDFGDLADAAVAALVQEATLTPKPGLVDLRGGGAHPDMDVDLMIASAHALRPSFARMAVRVDGAPDGPPDLGAVRTRLAAIGRDAERDMFAVTGGVNTHRGAIWALGLTIGALASLASEPGPADAGTVLRRVAAIAAQADARPDLSTPPTTGARTRARYRVPGAVGAAQAGFPQALTAFAALRRRPASGAGRTHVQLDALLGSMTTLDDTCLLSRGGPSGLALARAGARQVLALGGSATAAGSIALARLDATLTSTRLSPGGSADMLALALLLDATTAPPTRSLRKDS